jgi:hypothetical protein
MAAQASNATHANKSAPVYKGLIQNEEELKTAKWDKFVFPVKSASAPEHPEQQRVWIKRIFDAINNREGVVDEGRSLENWKRNPYPKIEIEIAAWQLLVRIIIFTCVKISVTNF